MLERDGTIAWLNRAARQVVGDRTGAHFSKVVAAESVPRVRREFTRKILGTASATEYEAHLLGADGGRIPVEISSVSVMGDGQIVGVFGAARVEGERVRPLLHPLLTPRQLEVLKLLAQGRSTEQVAAALGVADETARNHIRAVLRRLGVHSRLEAVAAAHNERLI
jgi:DNA-binding CsgD family transcriptional regulator